MDARLSVVILTKNEEDNIIDCLESVLFADEIIIIDDFSNDRTTEIIKSLDNKKIKVFQKKLNNDFSQQRNYGLLKSTGKWVMFVDADERVCEELTSEISNFKFQISNDISGYYIKRKDYMWGRELIFGETGDIKLLRLARKETGKWEGKVHEEWKIKGKTREIEGYLLHYPHKDVKSFLAEINYYTDIRAKFLFNKGVEADWKSTLTYPVGKFLLNYLIKKGFLDGLRGFVFAMMMSFHSFLVRAKIWQLYQKNLK